MTAVNLRPAGAMRLLLVACALILGLFSTHTVAVGHPPVSDSIAAAGVSERVSGQAAEPDVSAGAAARVNADACDRAHDLKCCSEPVECTEEATSVVPVLTVFGSPAFFAVVSPPAAPPSAVEPAVIPLSAPSLVKLSISRV